MTGEIFTCGEINERLWWLRRKSDAHGPPDTIHTAHITRGHLTSHLCQLLSHLLSCRQKKIKVAQTNYTRLCVVWVVEENQNWFYMTDVMVVSQGWFVYFFNYFFLHGLLARVAGQEVNEVLSSVQLLSRGTKGGHMSLTGFLPSSISLTLGASKQIMLGGCLALRRSFCASCRSRRSFVVSSNFCWIFRASVMDNKHARLCLLSVQHLHVPKTSLIFFKPCCRLLWLTVILMSELRESRETLMGY